MKKILKYIPVIINRFFRILFLKNLTLTTRISIILNTLVSLLINSFTRRRAVRYFGHPFVYEYWSDPITFLTYPYEISESILNQIEPDSIKKVLDIGGNIGQFSITMANMTKAEIIDVFEPNEEIFHILTKNTKSYKKIRIFNYGIGKNGFSKFYYKTGKSATGSVIKDNAYNDTEELNELKVSLISNVGKVTGNKNYDLVKIDVEGFEMEVIKNLKGTSTKYLLIEVSSNREKHYTTSELYTQIANTFGKFEILFQHSSNAITNSYDVLLKFNPHS